MWDFQSLGKLFRYAALKRNIELINHLFLFLLDVQTMP